MKQYLYGASVQGIQDYIFETNKLVEIIGASELVEFVSTQFIREVFKKIPLTFEEKKVITLAAGNIKYLFDREEDCRALVRIFPYKIAQLAPGLSLSQAVISFDTAQPGDDNIGHRISELEQKLKQQRNKLPVAHGLGLMISRRAPLTGRPGVGFESNNRNSEAAEIIDAQQAAKIDYADKKNIYNKIVPHIREGIQHHDFPKLMDDIAANNKGNWIAVVHADGNNLGKKLLAMADQGAKPEDFRLLSKLLEEANVKAFAAAMRKVLDDYFSGADRHALLPLRPVVLGGDDLTFIIRGDWAIDFTANFLKAFEEQTKQLFGNFPFKEFHRGLTACAGIAFIKPSFPFHYGAELSEQLCSYAKDKSKKIDENHSPSSIMFHRVLSSFVDDNYQDVIRRELSVTTTNNNEKVLLANGPYFLQKEQHNYLTVEELLTMVRLINNDDAPRSRLRNWLTEFQSNQERAERSLERIRSLYRSYIVKLQLNEPIKTVDDQKKTHLHDLLTLSSIM